ncbi:MAG: hypothetical protein EAX96_08120 [Candidatus Lokiarchaeota archaeon]|nr:hypothetical protein [Candidatus Lokiarchaeota archaeon]
MPFKDRGRNRGLIGHVEWKDGTPASDLIIELEERDLLFNDALPSAKTDLDGNFVITYHPEDYGAIFAEKPDINLSIEYLNEKNEKKVFSKFYPSIKDEWLSLDLKLEDNPSPNPPIKDEIPTGSIRTTVNLKNKLNINDIEDNKLWEIFIGTSTAFSRLRKHYDLKLKSWGGRIVVGEVITEGSLRRAERNLTPDGMLLLQQRKNIPKKMDLKFLWLDKEGNVSHDLLVSNEERSCLSERELRLLPSALTLKIRDKASLPAETLKVIATIQIENVTFSYELICIDSLTSLESIIDTELN